MNPPSPEPVTIVKDCAPVSSGARKKQEKTGPDHRKTAGVSVSMLRRCGGCGMGASRRWNKGRLEGPGAYVLQCPLENKAPAGKQAGPRHTAAGRRRQYRWRLHYPPAWMAAHRLKMPRKKASHALAVEAAPVFAEDEDIFETANFQAGTLLDSVRGEDASFRQPPEN